MSEWIPLIKQQPPKDYRVLLVDEHGWITTGFVRCWVRKLTGKKREPVIEKAIIELSDGEEHGCLATHWMPLPEPPRE